MTTTASSVLISQIAWKVIAIQNFKPERGWNMLSQLPIRLEKVDGENIDKEILRAGIIAELDAISFYEQMAAATENENIKKVLLDIAREEKTHVGEFETLLLKLDKEQVKELEKGKQEINELAQYS